MGQANHIEDRQQWILRNCKVGERIIDVGGNDGHIFANTIFAKYVTTVDIDKYDIPNFYQMDAHDLKFPDKAFDIAILGELLEHVEDPVRVLKEAKRVAKRLLMTIPDEYNWDKSLFPFQTIEESCKIKNKTIEELAREGNPNAKEFNTEDGYRHLWHNRYYKEDTLRKDIESAGITDYKLERLQYNGWTFFVVDTKIDSNIPEVVIQTSIASSNPNAKIDIPKGPIITFGSDVTIDSVIPGKGKMRIALVSTPFFGVPPVKYGGLEQIVWDLAEGLDELGHLVTIFGPEGSKTPKHGSLVITGPALDTVNCNWLEEEEKRYLKWKDIVSNDRFDVIHDHSWFAYSYFHKMSNLKLKVIHTHHSGYNWQTAPPFPKPNLVSISKWMKLYTEAYFKQKGFDIQSEYVYNGVDLDRYSFDPTIKRTDSLLFVGRLSTFKQPHSAVKIARETNHKLDIIGSASFVDSQDYVKQLEKSVESDPNIVLYENASHELKIKKMQEAKAIIIPSKFNEPFGLVAIEAMACGCPVICLRDGALPEIVIDNKTGFVCDTEEQMIETINNVNTINHEDCRKRAEQFSKKIMAENYVKLYQKMMKGDNW